MNLKYLLLGLYFSIAFSAEESQPLTVTADTITCEQKENFCIAEGNVKAVYEKTNESPSVLTCKILKVYFDKNKNDEQKKEESPSPLGARQIKKMEAFHDVVVVSKETTVKAKEANYNTKEDVIEFFHDVKIHNNSDKSQGFSKSEYAIMDRKTGKSVLNNQNAEEKKQVQLIFYPKEPKTIEKQSHSINKKK